MNTVVQCVIAELVAQRDEIDRVLAVLRGSAASRLGKPAAKQADARPTPKAAPEVAPTAAISTSARVLDVLQKSSVPLLAREIAGKTIRPLADVRYVLKALKKQGRVVLNGKTAAARWMVVKPTSRGDEFEQVWDGTRERKGEVASLSSVGRA